MTMILMAVGGLMAAFLPRRPAAVPEQESANLELRADGGTELRADGGNELRA